MCTGHTHALAGAVAGGSAGLLALHLPLTQTALLAGLSAGAGVLPDLDHPQATLAHTFGFLTKAFAWCVGRICGGHRHGSHTLAAVGVFSAIAYAAVAFRHDLAGRIVLGVLLTLIVAGALTGLRLGGHAADLLAVAAAIAMCSTGEGLGLVALATAIGCGAHLVTDALTDTGVPLLLPFTGRRFRWWPEPFAFTTNTLPELVIVDPLLIGALGALGWLAVR